MNDASKNPSCPVATPGRCPAARQGWQWGARPDQTATAAAPTQPLQPAADKSAPGATGALTTTTRSGVAQWLFPRLSKKDAGIRVATDIQRFPELRSPMLRAGYVPHRVGYTNEQIEILKKFYKR